MPGTEAPAAHSEIDLQALLPPGPLRPRGVSLRYRLAVLVVAAVMVLLPVLYVGLIAAVGAATRWHAIEHVGWVLGPRDMNRGLLFWRLVAYVAPFLIGPVAIAFLIKPFFAPRRRPAENILLTRDQEPRLFAFVAQLCRLIKATEPSVIAVDVRVNASASWEGGFTGGLHQRLRLTLGLPLVASLPVDRLAGVLVHEFGHFRQGGGMGATFIVDSINDWFAEAVHGRDRWDEKLKELQDEKFHALGLIAIGAGFFVWCTRRILWLLMQAGRLASLALSRQMEVDADTHEVELVGTEAAVRTTLQLRLMAGAGSRIEESAGDFFNQRDQLPADLPGLIGRYVEAHAPAALASIEAGLAEEKTGRFDSHPCDRERIALARRLARPGVLRCDRPARVLFADFDRLARSATAHHYATTRRVDLGRVTLIDGGPVLRHRLATDARRRAYPWFTDDRLFPLLGYDLSLALPDEARGDVAGWLESRLAFIRRPTGAVPLALHEFNCAWREVEAMEKCHSLQLCGENFLARAGSLNKAKDVASAAALVAEARAGLDRAAAAAQPLAAAFSEAFAAARELIAAEMDDEARARFEARWRLLGKVLAASRITFEASLDLACILDLHKAWGDDAPKAEARRAVEMKHRERFLRTRAALEELFRGEFWPDPLGGDPRPVNDTLACELDPDGDVLASVQRRCRVIAGGRSELEAFLVGDVAARVRRILQRRAGDGVASGTP